MRLSAVRPGKTQVRRWIRFGAGLALALLVVSSRSFAQATFALQNRPVDAPVYDWTGALLSGADWRAELYGGATADSLTPTIGWNSLTRELAGFVGPGYFRGDDYVYVAEVRPGGSAWLQVKVWNVQLGATYEEAVAGALGGYGQSELFYAQSDPTMIFPAQLVGLQSFSVLQVIPEPSTWALFGLGALVFAAKLRTSARQLRGSMP